MSGYIQLPKPSNRPSRTMEARHDGTCEVCTEQIEQGDPIRLLDGEPMHEACAEEEYG